jgi:spore photoproduct lyase
MRERFPGTRLLSGEQTACADGKLRYFHPLRVQMYRQMLRWIRRAAPIVPVYLCMETKEVWRQVFGFAPSCEKELGGRLANFTS